MHLLYTGCPLLIHTGGAIYCERITFSPALSPSFPPSLEHMASV
jgi:hypothetical protein